MPRQIEGSQWNFEFGEVDVEFKRADDHPARKGGLRQMVNARIHNARTIRNRPGRRALYPITNGGVRTERFLISSGNVFDIQFGPGRLKIINSAGVVVGNFSTQGNGAVLPWASTADINSIVYTIFNQTITICFGHAMRPQVVTFDGISAWSIADYAEAISTGGQKRTPFYRISPQNVTMFPSGNQGAITLQFSSPIVVAGMAGTRMRFCGRQILLGAMIDPSNIHATVVESLPPSETLTLSSAAGQFNIGDVVEGSTTGAIGIVTTSPNQQTITSSAGFGLINVGDALVGGTSGATGIVISNGGGPLSPTFAVSLSTGTPFVVAEVVTGPGGTRTVGSTTGATLVVQLLQNSGALKGFGNELVVGPSASAVVSNSSVVAPTAVSVWDDEIINGFRGFPAACFVDQFRLGFCDFPAVPGGIGWSAINSPTDLYANDASSPDNAIFEIAPKKARVFYVIPGPEGSEFVICDTALWYIPISVTSPLKPGSVAFNLLSGDGCAQVQPKLAQEAVLYINAGGNSVMAVIATGAYNRPYNSKNLSDYHAHLFNNIVAIAAPSADGTFNERYAYILNGDGSITVGKYSPDSLQTSAPTIGWGPWSGAGAVSWIAAYAADVLFTSDYGLTSVVEALDDNQYLDCALPVNAAPAAFAPPAGMGPLWFVAGQTVDLMDQGTRPMGLYWVDLLGFIIPQFNGGEDLTRADLVAGQPWTGIAEPFAPNATPGADVHQRMELRQFSKFAVYVLNSIGFKFVSLFSGKQTAKSPVPGAITAQRIVPPYNIDDDATKPPYQRETVEFWAPTGSSYDPRCAIIWDTPGPIEILEFAMEITL